MANDEWATPQWLFDRIDAVFHFEVDMAASAENAKCARYCTEETDALQQQRWEFSPAWVNPPYSNLLPWMKKIRKETSTSDTCVVALLPVCPATRWFQHVWDIYDALLFFNRRIKFEGASGSPRFDSVLAVFNMPLGIPTIKLYELRDLGRWIMY